MPFNSIGILSKEFYYFICSHRFSAIEEKKTNMLNTSYNCFSYVTTLQNTPTKTSAESPENNDVNDEKWLCHYMLGKIAEKRKEDPSVYLKHYLMVCNV